MSDGALKRTMDEASLSPDASQSKKHQGVGSPENSVTQSLPSLSDKLTSVNKISVDICGHCNETCDVDGVKGEAFQCDLCEGWFHALCENIGSKHYKSFSSLAKSIPNIAYYCNYNKCYARMKCIVAEFVRSSVNESVKISNVVENLLQRFDKSLASTLTAQIGKSIEDLSA